MLDDPIQSADRECVALRFDYQVIQFSELVDIKQASINSRRQYIAL